MDHKFADLTFGISHQAYAVLQYVSRYSGEDICADFKWPGHGTETRLFHNCREQGIAIVMRRPNDDMRRVIWWAEHRNSDGIFVDWFDKERLTDSWNDVPTVADLADDGSKWDYDKGTYGRKCFGYADIGRVVDFIIGKAKEFWGEQAAA